VTGRKLHLRLFLRIEKMTESGVFGKKIIDPHFEAPLDIWESFASFLKQNSYKKNEIIQRTPQKHIASFLGITPECFSRIQ